VGWPIVVVWTFGTLYFFANRAIYYPSKYPQGFWDIRAVDAKTGGSMGDALFARQRREKIHRVSKGTSGRLLHRYRQKLESFYGELAASERR